MVGTMVELGVFGRARENAEGRKEQSGQIVPKGMAGVCTFYEYSRARGRILLWLGGARRGLVEHIIITWRNEHKKIHLVRLFKSLEHVVVYSDLFGSEKQFGL